MAPIRWAFHSFVYTQQLRVEDSWHLLAEDARLAGFHGVEVFLDDFASDEQTRRIGAAFSGEGIEVLGASFASHLYDAASHAETLDLIDRLTDRLAEVGGSILGLSGSQPERLKTEEEFAQQADLVARIVELVAPKRLEVAYHTYPQDAADDCREIRELTNRLGPDILRLGPDLGWLEFAGVSAAEFIRRFGDRIDFVHLRDESLGVWPEAVGGGAVDWPAVVSELRQIGYDGWWCVELADSEDVDYVIPLRERHRQSREYLERLLTAPGIAGP